MGHRGLVSKIYGSEYLIMVCSMQCYGTEVCGRSWPQQNDNVFYLKIVFVSLPKCSAAFLQENGVICGLLRAS